jgi:hypothetical protein
MEVFTYRQPTIVESLPHSVGCRSLQNDIARQA